jgi:hypothetical protein
MLKKIILFFLETEKKNMRDCWLIVFNFANTDDLLRLVNVNRSLKTCVSQFLAHQCLTIHAKQMLAFSNNVLRARNVKLLRGTIFETDEEMKIALRCLCKLKFLVKLDLWSESDLILIEAAHLPLLPLTISHLRLDLNFSIFLNLPLMGHNLEHLAFYCVDDPWEYCNLNTRLQEVFLQLPKLKCVHIYGKINSVWASRICKMKWPFSVCSSTIFTEDSESEFNCEHMIH